MRALVQRVAEASVSVDGRAIGAIGPGLCVFVGVTHDDDEARAAKLAEKVWNLRVFADADGVMNRSLADLSSEEPEPGEPAPEGSPVAAVLVISQFTLYGDTSRGRRPSWHAAARPEHAEPLVAAFAANLAGLGAVVATGAFGAEMAVALVNDGPVTLWLEV